MVSIYWLIERGQAQNHAPTIWWAGDRVIGGWTDQVNLAIRFGRKEDAEVVANMELFHRPWGIIEHMWLDEDPA